MKINLRGFRVTVVQAVPEYSAVLRPAPSNVLQSCGRRECGVAPAGSSASDTARRSTCCQSTDCQVITGELIREQDSTGPSFLKPVLCKDIQTPLGKDRIAVHPVFCIPDMDLHLCAGNIIIMQMDDFGNTHSGRIHGCKHSCILYVVNSVQQAVDFINRQNSWKFMFQNHARDCNVIPKGCAGHSDRKSGWQNYKGSEWWLSALRPFLQEEKP